VADLPSMQADYQQALTQAIDYTRGLLTSYDPEGAGPQASLDTPPQWRAPALSAGAPSWQPPEEPPQLSQVSLGVYPDAKPGYPGRQIWMHAQDPGYSTHLNIIERFGDKDYIIPTIYNGRHVSREDARQIALQNNLIDPETGHPFPEETGIIAEGPYAGWGQVEKPWHDALEHQAEQAMQQTDNGRQYLQWRDSQHGAPHGQE
jgi:hypothetical protein